MLFATSPFVSTVLRTRYFITERHYYKIVTRFSKPKKTKSERLPEIKNNTLFSVKNEVVRLSSINGNFATNNARDFFKNSRRKHLGKMKVLAFKSMLA
jgi:hypothetical protein